KVARRATGKLPQHKCGSGIERLHVCGILCLLCWSRAGGECRLAGLEGVREIFDHEWEISNLLVVIYQIKQFVRNNRSRYRASGLLSPLRRFDRSQRIARCEILIAVIVKAVPVKRVAAGAQYHVHAAAGSPAELRRIGGLANLEFLYSIRADS